MNSRRAPLIVFGFIMGCFVLLAIISEVMYDRGEYLVTAAEQCRYDDATSALRTGARVNATRDDGETALRAALNSNCGSVAQLLLNRGANINTGDIFRIRNQPRLVKIADWLDKHPDYASTHQEN